MHNLSSKKKFLPGVIFLIFALLFVVVFLHKQESKNVNGDSFFIQAIKKNNREVQSSIQHTKTKSTLNSGPIEVIGEYTLNRSTDRYFSISTTSSHELDHGGAQKLNTFTLTNISIGSKIYTKIGASSDFLKSRGIETNKWLYFTENNVPERYQGIAVSGPITDVFRIFLKNGVYLKILEKYDSISAEEKTIKYILSLSEEAFVSGQEDLGVLLERLGRDGKINIWFDKETLFVKRVEMKNPPYFSETEVTNINDVPAIKAPLDL